MNVSHYLTNDEIIFLRKLEEDKQTSGGDADAHSVQFQSVSVVPRPLGKAGCVHLIRPSVDSSSIVLLEWNLRVDKSCRAI